MADADSTAIDTENRSNFDGLTDEQINSMDNDEFAEKLYLDMEKREACLSMDEMDAIEKFWEVDRVCRRMSLIHLTKPFKEISDMVKSNDEFALAVTDTLDLLNTESYEQFLSYLQQALTVMMLALAGREDMNQLRDKARAERVN